jgi:hypothetical protein
MLPYFARNLHIWMPGYLQERWARDPAHLDGTAVWLTIADHYEPFWAKADYDTARQRVSRWYQQWPGIAARYRDSAGRAPRYTFFYPEEEYHPDMLAPLAELAHADIADVEVHLHHDGEGEQNFVERIRRFTETLYLRHRLLREEQGKLRFGFIHGNWALDNSRSDGRACGLNNELALLGELGCYADFTLPSAPAVTQTRIVNTIYWAWDNPLKPKSHDSGVPVKPGMSGRGDLLMIPGPLGLNYRGARRFVPRLETGELAWYDPPVAGRARSWLNLAPRIGNQIFLKLFSHGAQEKNASALLDGGLERCLEDVLNECARRRYQIYFASAWEMRLAVEGAQKHKPWFEQFRSCAEQGPMHHA